MNLNLCLIVSSLINYDLIVSAHNFVYFLFYAAKLLYQTAKTCQYVKENAKKMHFFIKSEQAIDEIKREEEVGVFKI